jgi:hypothetical protein
MVSHADVPPSFPMAQGVNEIGYTNNVTDYLNSRIASLKGELVDQGSMLPSPMYGAGTENLETNND